MRKVLFRTDVGDWVNPEEMHIYVVTIDEPAPEPKTTYVELPGRDDVLDMSEWAGVLRYGSRVITVSLRDMEGNKDWIIDKLYGRKARIYTDEDRSYYYEGRCDKLEVAYMQQGVWDLDFSFTCGAYKLRHTDTTVSATAPATVTLKAERRPAIPTITASGACTITIGGVDHECAAGTFQLPDLLLTTTPRDVIIAGSGVTVDFTWTDGRL